MAPNTLPEETIRTYRDQGYVHIPGVLSEDEVREYREAVRRLTKERCEARRDVDPADRSAFFFEAPPAGDPLRKLLFHPGVIAAAEALAGRPMRLWDGGALIKDEGSRRTVIHDDQSNYPFANAPDALSVWIALVDVPAERGCMTYLTGTHRRPEPPPGVRPPGGWAGQEVVYQQWPELEWTPRVAAPIRAGDCNFHHAREMHFANANTTDMTRLCFGTTFVNAEAVYRPTPESNPLDLDPGTPLPGELFPMLGDIDGAEFIGAQRPPTA